MNSTTDTIGNEKLRSYLHRANYAVLKDSNIFKLSNDMKGEFDDLCVAYADKFPIASGHVYACRLNDEENDEEKHIPVEAVVAPTSLLYSMPDEWQDRFCLVLDALNDIEWDDDSYHVVLLDPTEQRTCNDPFGDRHKRWKTDDIGCDTSYPYGKD